MIQPHLRVQQLHQYWQIKTNTSRKIWKLQNLYTCFIMLKSNSTGTYTIPPTNTSIKNRKNIKANSNERSIISSLRNKPWGWRFCFNTNSRNALCSFEMCITFEGVNFSFPFLQGYWKNYLQGVPVFFTKTEIAVHSIHQARQASTNGYNPSNLQDQLISQELEPPKTYGR